MRVRWVGERDLSLTQLKECGQRRFLRVFSGKDNQPFVTRRAHPTEHKTHCCTQTQTHTPGYQPASQHCCWWPRLFTWEKKATSFLELTSVSSSTTAEWVGRVYELQRNEAETDGDNKSVRIINIENKKKNKRNAVEK